IYLAALLGNGLIITTIAWDQHLHTPMYFFLLNLALLILRAVLRIPSEQGRHKAFSTCLPHLAVISLFAGTSFFAYLKPPSISSPSLDLLVSVLYSLITPTLNPLIYSMRNRELKDALRKLMEGCI
ncbi:olfactory receptor 1J2-like, partial [Columba livia]|uniref:olfactory receptor 1J2-like n=1 Tax=Columba livia TaxID=8932 RepID=UPI0031B9FA14